MLHDQSCFVTLTYAPENVPEHGTLKKRHVQLFMKRLRKYSGRRMRFFACGEYGEQTGRPHYHVVLFGFDFEDKAFWTKRGAHRVWRSELLEKCWPLGHSEIGSLNAESVKYVAGYVTKKWSVVPQDYEVLDMATGEVVEKEREFALMSRRPGIGRFFYDQYKEQLARDGTVIDNGHEVRLPKYYEKQMESEFPQRLEELRKKRHAWIDKKDRTDPRLAAREKCAEAKVNLKKRGLQ